MDHHASTSSDQKFTEGEHSDVQRETPQKNTILHVAAKQKQVETPGKINEKHPSLLHQTNSKNDTPLHIAARIGCLEMVQLLIKPANKDQDVEADKNLLRMVNVRKDTALHEAVRNGHFEIVKLLIEKDSDLASLENDAGESALFLAVDRKYFEIAGHILQEAPSCSYRGRNRMNVMHAAIIRTSKAKNYYRRIHASEFITFTFIIHMIKTTFWKSNKTNELGRTETVFIEEVKNKFPSTILEADEFGWIPLHYAALVGHVEAVELFLKDNNSLAYRKDSEGMSAIHIAAREGHVDVMKELIKSCPDASELLNDKDRTALHVAAESGKAKVVEYILKTPDFDGLINEQDKEGNTPLMLAGVYGHHKVAFLLANDSSSSRVDKEAVNRKGLTAFDIILANTKIGPSKRGQLAMTLEWTCGLAIACMKGEINTENTITEKKAEENNEKPGAQDLKENQVVKEVRDISRFDLLILTIIASVTFTAGLNITGGPEDNGVDYKRDSISFMNLNEWTFYSSVFAIYIHFALHFALCLPYIRTNRFLNRNFFFVVVSIAIAKTLTYISLLSMLIAFAMANRAALDKFNSS